MYPSLPEKGYAVIVTSEGHGTTPLSAFDSAEVNAGITGINLVKVTSFIPPGWKIIKLPPEILSKIAKDGKLVLGAFEYATSKTTSVSAAIAIGLPRDPSLPCIIMEHSSDILTAYDLLKSTVRTVEEVFRNRDWAIADIKKEAIEAHPKKGLYACAFAAVLFFEKSEVDRYLKKGKRY